MSAFDNTNPEVAKATKATKATKEEMERWSHARTGRIRMRPLQGKRVALHPRTVISGEIKLGVASTFAEAAAPKSITQAARVRGAEDVGSMRDMADCLQAATDAGIEVEPIVQDTASCLIQGLISASVLEQLRVGVDDIGCVAVLIGPVFEATWHCRICPDRAYIPPNTIAFEGLQTGQERSEILLARWRLSPSAKKSGFKIFPC